MLRRLLTVLGVVTVGFVLAARADDRLPTKVKVKSSSEGPVRVEGDSKLIQEDAAAKQERLKRQFDDFKQSLLQLAQRLDKSPREEDRSKAEVLRTAIKKASDEGVDTKFTVLVDGLKKASMMERTEDLEVWLTQNKELRSNLRDIIELLLKDDRDAQLRAEREKTMRLIEELKQIIKKQELHRTKVQMGRGETQDLARQQQKISNQTANLGQKNKSTEAKPGEAKDAGKKGREGVGESKNDTKDPKADPKKGEGKDGKDGKAGEGKDSKDGKDGKAGEGKDSKAGEGKEGKGGEGKEGKEGEGKDGKGGEGKEGKPGEGKDGKGGEGKEGKPGEGKQGKPGEGKDGKPGEGKQGKPGEGKDGKPGEGKGKPTDAKPGGGKPGAGKPGEGKQGKPGEGKSGDSKGKGEGKGDAKGGKGGEGKAGQGKPGEGKGGKGGKGGQGGQSGQQGEAKGGGQQGGGQQKQQPPQDITQIKKQVQDANKYQEKAENELKKEDRKNAGKDEETAEEKLKEAVKKLEDLLRQIREEEIERLLARLEQRVRHMLAMQIDVRDRTVELDRKIQGNADKKKTRADDQEATGMADKENEIIREANDAIRLLESEGSDVAFSEVFKQVRADMETVEAHLRKADVGLITVTTENDIIDTLKEMLEALKKAQKKPGKPGKPGQGGGGPPPDPKLIDLLSELKMIRSMQKRVNDRTTVYGKQYNGEQAPAPESVSDAKERELLERIQQELKDLAGRQKKIGRITRDIAEGKTEDK